MCDTRKNLSLHAIMRFQWWDGSTASSIKSVVTEDFNFFVANLKNVFYLIYFIDTFLVGKSSNFAIVVARLIVDAKDHGIQMFIVQLRDLNTHQPLPGVFCNIFYIVL